MRLGPFLSVTLTVLVATVCGYSETWAQKRSPYEVKAAGLYNFARFVQWPVEAFPDTGREIVIGILGDDPFDDILPRTIAGKTVNGRELSIRHFRELDDIDSCHILFISSDCSDLDQILTHTQGMKFLTVGETEGFASHGGMIGFVIRDNKIRCEINTNAAERSGLKISPKLLNVATIVTEDRSETENKDALPR